MNCLKAEYDDDEDLYLFKKDKVTINKEMNLSKLMKYYTQIWIPFMENNKIENIIEINEIQIKGIYNKFNWYISLFFYDKIIDIQVWKWGLIWKPKLNNSSQNGIDELLDYFKGNYNSVFNILHLIKVEINKVLKTKIQK